MITSVVSVLVSMVTAAIVNEFSDVAPWLAQKIVRRAAALWALGDPDVAEALSEEWAAVIDAAPGKLTKLGHSGLFISGAAWRFQHHRFRCWARTSSRRMREASTLSAQNILLAIGALLIGVSAVLFAGLAVANPLARAAILAVATAIALVVAPGIARRGLSSAAETVAGIGLILLPMTLYALHGSSLPGGLVVPAQAYLGGIVFVITAVAGFLYASATRLSAPGFATVVALQPVPLLLAYSMVQSPLGWGFALTVVALLDRLLLTIVIPRGRLVPRRPVVGGWEGLAHADDAHQAGVADFGRRGDAPDLADPAAHAAGTSVRSESAPEEPNLIIPALAGPRRRWLRKLTFALLWTASAGALLYSSAALFQAGTLPDRLRSALIVVLAAAAGLVPRWLEGSPVAGDRESLARADDVHQVAGARTHS